MGCARTNRDSSVLVVEGAFQDRRELSESGLAILGGQIDIGRQADSVPHRDHHILRNRNPVLKLWLGNRQIAGTRTEEGEYDQALT